MAKSINEILAVHEGGIYKRIDENRELMELLSTKAPSFLSDHPWVVRWLKSQDAFLCDIESAAGNLETVRFHKCEGYPRPLPSFVKE